MLVSIILPIVSIPAVSAADSADWYMTVSGNLSTDAYKLYPFSAYNSLKIGFSKFGEIINSNDNVGLEYGSVDPFAPASGSSVGNIVKSAWLNGWICNITYVHTIRSELRNVWVSAQHGDPNGVTYGGDWIRVDFLNDKSIAYGDEDPRDPGYIMGNYAAGDQNYGGRKTNGTTVTDPLQVLYDGPRSFVALLKTRVYDHFLYQSDNTAEDIPLLEVRFMIIFEKCKKEVVVFKELKTLVTDKYTDILKVQFSNRGEVDLGTDADGYASYFHFYTQGTISWPGSLYNDTLAEGLPTVYDRNWVLNTTESPSTSTWKNFSAAGPYPQTSSATYDLAVAINPNVGYFGYTWWAAFWPSLSDWSIDGWPNWWHSLTALDAHTIDSRVNDTYPRTEPTIPYYIGEWDVELKPHGKETPSGGMDQQMYRFVTVYGVSDKQDGQDYDQGTLPYPPFHYQNLIDSEMAYQLAEVFNPWDLQQAVHKTMRSWVEWTTGSTTYLTLRKPVVVVSPSIGVYNQGSERVIDYNGTFGAGTLYRTALFSQYTFTLNANGTATVGGLNATHLYKILYNTLPDVSGSAVAASTFTSELFNSTDGSSLANGTTVTARTATSTWDDNIDVTHSFSATVPAFAVNMTYANSSSPAVLAAALAENWTNTWSIAKAYNETNFKVFLGETYVATLENLYDPINVTLANTTFLFDFGSISKSLKSPDLAAVIWPNDKSETVHVAYLNHSINFAISITNTNYSITQEAGAGVTLNQTYAVTATLTVTANYRDYLMGRYEWAVVGRDAASVDSAGAALVTAAFKNKQVEIWMAGADMMNPLVANQMPWVMSKMTEGDNWVNYLKTGSGTDPGNYRAYLRDDWCKLGTSANDEIPVASSNLIGVGGPLANLLAYYANDFTDAMFGLADFTNYTAWENKIVAKTCWNHTQGYVDSNTVGYAVVTTYRDINETVVFLIWGNWGRDTFYATRWFHEHLVYQLQSAPAGLTSVVVRIAYQSTAEGYKPTGFSIVECLGTISERTWVHGSLTKGGIHDP